MKKLRYFFRLIGAFLGRFKLHIFISLLLGIIIFVGILAFAPYLAYIVSPPRIGVIGRFRVEDVPSFLASQVSMGLTQTDTEGYIKPGLAKSWTTPDNGKTWVFILDESIRWHDNSPVRSDDINYEFSDVTIERPDKTTIIFKLGESYSPFPTVVTRPVFKKGLLGTHDWKVDKISLVENYLSYVKIINRKDKQGVKIYKFYPNEDQAKLAFKLGEIDEIQNLYEPQPFDTWKNTTISKTIDNKQIITLFFNTKDPLLSDKSLRQALTYAIEKKNNVGERAFGPIPRQSWAYNSQVKPYEYSTERAQELLDEYQKDKTAEKIKIALVTTPILLPTAEAISENWKALGIESSVLVSSVVPEDFQAYLSIYETPLDPDQYPIWHSTQTATNISRYQSPRIDKLLEDGRLELDIEKRRKIYLDFQRYLMEDLPAAFLYNPYLYTVTRK